MRSDHNPNECNVKARKEQASERPAWMDEADEMELLARDRREQKEIDRIDTGHAFDYRDIEW